MKGLDVFKGCFIGGAVGDALGYAVEFMDAASIFRRYGAGGIVSYELRKGVAQISDDTQMTLFTAVGILASVAQGEVERANEFIYRAYRDWYGCQCSSSEVPPQNRSWIAEYGEMHQRRAPGNTCMEALGSGRKGSPEQPINASKGCGGVMRVAPIGLYFDFANGAAAQMGAKAAALTHGHESGYISAAALTHLISLICRDPDTDMRNAVLKMRSSWQVNNLFKSDVHRQCFLKRIDAALELSQNSENDLAAIHQLGEGWVGDEALAIALYCALKYENDFEQAVIAAVNHSGDSDSTGAITGNILGAHLGLKAIPQKYLANLEFKQVILEVAEDLWYGSQSVEMGRKNVLRWDKKYVFGGGHSISGII